jgi:uncharacterized protein (DUF4213/DUF364 family)
MWKLYDELIERIPPDIDTEGILIGLDWTVVTAGKYCGTAMTVMEQESRCCSDILETGKGLPLKYLASFIKSWDFVKASVGAAAINAFYNNEDTWQQNCFAQHTPWKLISGENAFDGYAQAVKGKKAAVIGHFHQLEKYLEEAGVLSILERRPMEGDFPDSACEYILPEQDFVFITGTTLINKTLPRLLELSRNAHVVLVGPSTPMAPILFEHGVSELSGFLVRDREGIIDSVSVAGHKAFFRCGERTRMIRENT